MKKFYILLYFLLFIEQAFAIQNNHPFVPKLWLPWDDRTTTTVINKTWWYFIELFIQFVAVIAVISLMIAWIMYLISGWEEEKVKKAKSWIIWSLIWVFLSIAAWGIINAINNILINN